MENKKQYMVTVQGGHAPKTIHPTKKDAKTEAKRLSKQGQNIGKRVDVIKIKASYISIVEVKRIGDV